MTLIYFILIMFVTVLIHEFGHYLFAKRAGIYVYEFSIGMGPKLFQWHRKNDETVYSLRLLPIGGYVQMAGEEIEPDEAIPKEKRMQSKTWMQRFLTVVAGVLFNFLLAIVLLFIIGLVNGVPERKPYVGVVEENSAAALAGLEKGDLIVQIDNRKISSTDLFLLELQVRNGKTVSLEIERNGQKKTIDLAPKKETVDGKDQYHYGFGLDSKVTHGFFESIQYAFTKAFSLLEQMVYIIFYLFTGKLGLNSLAGPLGIFSIVGETAKAGLLNLVYLVALISINVGFINILPIPPFDGGRILFLILEKIKGKPVNPKIENTIQAVAMILMFALMIAITYNDVVRIFFSS